MKKVEQLLLQTEAAEKTLSAHQVPVAETSGLSYPVQITIDDSNSGCTQEVEEMEFTNYNHASIPTEYSYTNEVSSPVTKGTIGTGYIRELKIALPVCITCQ